MRKDGFKSLIVWQKAIDFSVDVYNITKKFPKDELFSLTNQIRRAVTSVPANIAEGYERQHNKEYLQFLYISQGSLGETETFLVLSQKLGYITKTEYDLIEKKRDEVGALLFGLIKSIR